MRPATARNDPSRDAYRAEPRSRPAMEEIQQRQAGCRRWLPARWCVRNTRRSTTLPPETEEKCLAPGRVAAAATSAVRSPSEPAQQHFRGRVIVQAGSSEGVQFQNTTAATRGLSAGRALSYRRRLAGRPRLPAPVDPQPLVGIFADDFLQLGLQRLRIARRVAGHRERRVEAQHVAAAPARTRARSRESPRPRCAPRTWQSRCRRRPALRRSPRRRRRRARRSDRSGCPPPDWRRAP